MARLTRRRQSARLGGIAKEAGPVSSRVSRSPQPPAAQSSPRTSDVPRRSPMRTRHQPPAPARENTPPPPPPPENPMPAAAAPRPGPRGGSLFRSANRRPIPRGVSLSDDDDSSSEDIAAEIVVRTDEMDIDEADSSEDSVSTPKNEPSSDDSVAVPESPEQFLESPVKAPESPEEQPVPDMPERPPPPLNLSISAMSDDESELSSIPSSRSSKATTPVDWDGPKELPPPLAAAVEAAIITPEPPAHEASTPAADDLRSPEPPSHDASSPLDDAISDPEPPTREASAAVDEIANNPEPPPREASAAVEDAMEDASDDVFKDAVEDVFKEFMEDFVEDAVEDAADEPEPSFRAASVAAEDCPSDPDAIPHAISRDISPPVRETASISEPPASDVQELAQDVQLDISMADPPPEAETAEPPPEVLMAEPALEVSEADPLPQSSQLRDPRSVPSRPPKFTIKHGGRRRYDVRPKMSIPPAMTPHEYAIQCIAAAEASRLTPYSLHQDEYLMLRDHISPAQITTYLNIRNGILRLWVRNPEVSVTREEAIGCAKDARWFDVANVCFDWLVRDGFINFGCAEVRLPRKNHVSTNGNGLVDPPPKRKTVVVIGAGLSGLGCARHLHTLFAQYSKRFRERGEQPPNVVVLEGRSRLGGRVYSRALKSGSTLEPNAVNGNRHTAEMGGMIITGFDRGNPINTLVRGQLGLAYHAIRPETMIYDTNGHPVDPVKDQLVESLYNYCLERVAEYKFKLPLPKLLEGNRDFIDEGKDSWAEGGIKTIAYLEETTAAQPHAPPVSEQNIAPRVDLVPVSSDRATGRIHVEPGKPGAIKASLKAKLMGWTLKHGVGEDKDLNLDSATQQPDATLGSVLDEAIMQYQDIVDLNSQDIRLMCWHIANLEYSNATNLNQLSIKGWDLDTGNEWEGRHSMIVGGYQNLPLGLAHFPSPLDIEYQKEVKAIWTGAPSQALATPASGTDAAPEPVPEAESPAFKVECMDGSTFEADYLVNTIPLGVLKHGDVQFQPPLPGWKTDAIGRLGYGVLNKVVLVYRKPFWDDDKDIFGVLRQPEGTQAESEAAGSVSPHPWLHSSQRGRFFQWFNVSRTSGMPVLLALMAGDAAYDTEKASNDDLVGEATEVLRSIFGQTVPDPVESIVTRWASDRFARGSYSSAGPAMQVDDYDIMSRPVGNHFFAGEHTTATHPATVHGAYLSGLRAASEVLGALLGPIEVPMPLIMPKDFSRKLAGTPDQMHLDMRKEAVQAHEIKVWEHTQSQLGDYPMPPAKVSHKAHVLFNKANYEAAREKCLENRRPGKAPPTANEVRTMGAKMWNAASEEDRRPFVEKHIELRDAYARDLAKYQAKAQEYDRRALEVREAFEKDHPPPFAIATLQPTISDGSNGAGTPVQNGVATASATATPETTADGTGELAIAFSTQQSKTATQPFPDHAENNDSDVEMEG